MPTAAPNPSAKPESGRDGKDGYALRECPEPYPSLADADIYQGRRENMTKAQKDKMQPTGERLEQPGKK